MGARWEDMVAADVHAGLIPEAVGRETEWLAERRAGRDTYSVNRQTPDGRWLQLKERRIPGGGFVLMWTDISDLVASQEKLKSALQAKEIESAAKTSLLYNVAHELRAPLATILACAEMITGAALGPLRHRRYNEFVTYIQASVNHSIGITNTLLDLAIFESRVLRLDEAVTDLDQLIDSAVQLVGVQSEKKGVQLIQIPMASAFRVRLDEQRMRQVFVNLLSNAIKFTPPGGSVQTGVLDYPEGELTVYVRDTGIGIPRGELRTVMEPFGRLRSRRTGQSEGTGLGLALSKAIVEAHDATIRLESTVGAGTTVFVHLPRARIVSA